MTQRILNLNGDWHFAYTRETPEELGGFPSAGEFAALMPVPSYVDDHIDRLNRTAKWSRGYAFNPDYRRVELPMGAGKPADSSLPYIYGVCWYKKQIWLDESDRGTRINLRIGGASVRSQVWFNGYYLGCHDTHQTPVSFPVEDHARFDAENEIIIAVSNYKDSIASCILRGYKGKSMGIYGNVSLQIGCGSVIDELYVQPDASLKVLTWELIVRGNCHDTICWEIVDQRGATVDHGQTPADGSVTVWQSNAEPLSPWDDHHPVLYSLKVSLKKGHHTLDCHTQRFGLRHARTEAERIIINGRVKQLRGLTEHAYFPETCTQPLDKNHYLARLRKCQELGFNWIRFHTWSPNEAYLAACDELGIYVQVETYNGFTMDNWQSLVHTYRTHPCVILYCCGNEVMLQNAMIAFLEQCAAYVHRHAPDAMFSPMQSLHGVDVLVERSDGGDVPDTDILPHNRRKMDWLKSFSDVLEPHRVAGFDTIHSTRESVMHNMQIYAGRAYLIHELGIIDSYLDLGLETRYESSRIGTDLFTSTRKMMQHEGILQYAPTYYRNSCAWAGALRKLLMEKARMCGLVSGYDYLGATDHHWHRGGYSCGIMNEFYELKPGQTAREIRYYNAESVIVLDASLNRNFCCGDEVSIRAYAAIFGEAALEDGILSWKLADQTGHILLRGSQGVRFLPCGQVSPAGNISFTIPDMLDATACTLHVQLDGGSYSLENEYRLWCFPTCTQANEIAVFDSPDASVYHKIARGEVAFITGKTPFPHLPTSFTKVMAGRTVGNSATWIHEHPMLQTFPHDGWCDLQFARMLDGGSAALFQQNRDLFAPVVEVAGTFKLPFLQAALFELQIGKGKCVFCTLNLQDDDPAAQHLKQSILQYMCTDQFQPEKTVSLECVLQLLEQRTDPDLDFDEEAHTDGNAAF